MSFHSEINGSMQQPESMSHSYSYSGLFLVLVVSMLLLLSVLALKRGVAEVNHVSAQATIKQWTRKWSSSTTLDQLKEVERKLQFALRLEPHSPAIHDDLGRLYSLATKIKTISGQKRREYGKLAMQQYRKALTYRPAYPYTWVNLALMKTWFGQVKDREFHAAFSNGIKYGPWEPKLQRHLVSIGLSHWMWLDKELRQATQLVLNRGMKIQPQQILKIARKKRKLHLLCQLNLTEGRLVEKACARKG